MGSRTDRGMKNEPNLNISFSHRIVEREFSTIPSFWSNPQMAGSRENMKVDCLWYALRAFSPVDSGTDGSGWLGSIYFTALRDSGFEAAQGVPIAFANR